MSASARTHGGRSSRWARLSPLVVVAAGMIAACGGCGGARGSVAAADATARVHTAAERARGAGDHGARRLAADEARHRVDVARERGGADPLLTEALRAQVRRGAVDAVTALLARWEPEPEQPDAWELAIQAELLVGRTSRAEERARVAQAHFADDRSRFTRLLYDVLRSDRERFPPPTDYDAAAFGDRFEDYAQSSSVLFRTWSDRETTGVFKPMQTVRHTNYRGEVAAWRLCQVLQCAFDIPFTRELRVSEPQVLSLTGVARFEDTRSFARPHSRLVWHTDEEGSRWLYGAWKRWEPGSMQFPVEWTPLWTPLVRAGASGEAARQRPVASFAVPLLQRSGASSGTSPRRGSDLAPEEQRWLRRYRAVDTHLRDSDLTTLARGLSDLHIFDALINNHDRYLPDELRWGMNCQFRMGRFLSIDNGAGFRTEQDHVARRVWRNLRPVEVVSKSFIDQIRWVEPDALFELLFPPSAYHPDDPERFAAFESRRHELLAWVDELVERFGEDAVYRFP
jgi:hypothetical protein